MSLPLQATKFEHCSIKMGSHNIVTNLASQTLHNRSEVTILTWKLPRLCQQQVLPRGKYLRQGLQRRRSPLNSLVSQPRPLFAPGGSYSSFCCLGKSLGLTVRGLYFLLRQSRTVLSTNNCYPMVSPHLLLSGELDAAAGDFIEKHQISTL